MIETCGVCLCVCMSVCVCERVEGGRGAGGGGGLLHTCRLSNFTGYLRVTKKWKLQPQVANSASRSPVPTLLFGFNGTETHRP